jgi:hypothetical protein
MGRYYNGDIDGKFWFAVQSSDASERFGGQGSQPEYTDYYFGEDDLDDVEKEIEVIEDALGEYKEIFDDFFKKNEGYNDEMLQNYFQERGKMLTLPEISAELSEYADLGMGIKIRDCIKEQGSCNFQAEH